MLRFGEEFELDLPAYELRRAGRHVGLERIPMTVLILLVERRPDLVTRDQIVEKVWGRGVFFDTDNSINVAIRKIRQALRDDPEQSRFIRTVTGMGYRFIAPVQEQAEGAPPPPQAAPPPEPPLPESQLGRQEPTAARDPAGPAEHSLPAAPPPGARPFWWNRMAVRRVTAILAILTILGMAILLLRRARSDSPASSGTARRMIAVLPFENLTGDATQDYFSDGFTEELITRLGSIEPHRLGVIARTSVMFYKRERAPLDRLARDLGVQYVLEGSVRRNGDRVRISAQLIQVADQTHLWARQYDRAQTDILRVQEEIAGEVADQVEATLGASRPALMPSTGLSPGDYQAYDLYLKGLYFWNQRTQAGLEQAIGFFQQALDRHPDDARAYAGVASSYALLAGYSYVPRPEAFEKARAAALRALEIDPDLAAAHTSLGYVNEQYDLDWQTAGDHFRKAIALEPNDATAHHWYGEYLAFQGRFDEALAEMDRARALDPRSLIIAADNGMFLYYARRYQQAIEQFRVVQAIDPTFPRSLGIVWSLAAQGRLEAALQQLREWQRRDDGPLPRSVAIYLYGRLGRTEQARRALHDMEESAPRLHLDMFYPRLVAALGMDLRDEALNALLQECRERRSANVAVGVDPIFDPLRTDPRFPELLRCARLAP